MRMNSGTKWNGTLAAVACLVLGGLALAGSPAPRPGGERIPPSQAERPALLAAVVTDLDPAEALAARRPVAVNLGPFDAKTTLDLYILAVYDRTRVGSTPFDQRIRLTLPDGGLYEDRVTPVDPAGLGPRTLERPDLGPHPVRVAQPARMLRLARALPGRIQPRLMRDAAFTSEALPVSGTWITAHNLYGEWRAEITLERDGRVLSRAATTFRVENPR